jgi:Acyltransferase
MALEPWRLQPARDTGLTPSERFRSVRRESGLLESVAQQTCFSVLRIYYSIAHRLTIAGRDKLPAHGPFVLAANHCSHLDALVLGAALRPRHRERAFPIAAGDVFFQTTAVSVFPQSCLTLCQCGGKTVVRMLLQSWVANCRKKSDFRHLPGGRTHAHRFNDAFQARTRDAGRRNKCSGCALRSYWNF